MIVLGNGQALKDTSVAVRECNGTRFINAPDDIRRYLSSHSASPMRRDRSRAGACSLNAAFRTP